MNGTMTYCALITVYFQKFRSSSAKNQFRCFPSRLELINDPLFNSFSVRFWLIHSDSHFRVCDSGLSSFLANFDTLFFEGFFVCSMIALNFPFQTAAGQFRRVSTSVSTNLCSHLFLGTKYSSLGFRRLIRS